MNKKIELFRQELSSYKTTLRLLERRTEEAERWRDISLRTTSGCTSSKDFTSVRATAISIEEECNDISLKANKQRQELIDRFSCLNSNGRELLEQFYINCKSYEDLAEQFHLSRKTIVRNISIAVNSLFDAEKNFK